MLNARFLNNYLITIQNSYNLAITTRDNTETTRIINFRLFQGAAFKGYDIILDRNQLRTADLIIRYGNNTVK